MIKSISFDEEKYKEQLDVYSRGYAVINLDAMESNMRSMHENLSPGTKMRGVIKTNGYGHGSIPVGKMLEKLDFVFGYAVATPEEAMQLREAGLEKAILILGYTFPYCYEKLAENDIRPAVFREDSLDLLCDAARKDGKKMKVHIKVDTGMGRIGITPDDEGIEFVKKVLSKAELEIEGVFTHFAKADEADKAYAHEQYRKFKSFTDRIEKELGYRIPLKHCANSATIIEMPDMQMDMVRAGITLYGLMPSDEVILGDVSLTAALSLHSHISYIKTVHEGESISYGGLFTAEKDTRVATVPLGYGDGYPRMLTGKGSVLIHGKRCRILGRICMDQFMVDVSEITDVREGDPVVLIGRQGDECITAEEIGDLSGRFNYELVSLLTDRVPRVYFFHGNCYSTCLSKLRW